METLKINSVNFDSCDELISFYDLNKHPNVRPRPEDILKNAVEQTAFIEIRDEKGNIVGAAGYFDYEDSQYFEIGSTLILKEGFGLQKLLISMRLLAIYTTTYGDMPVFTVVKKVNTERSTASIIKVGFQEWNDPPKALLDERNSSLGNKARGGNVNFFILTWSSEHIKAMAERFLHILKNPVIEKNGKAIRISIAHKWLKKPEVLRNIELLAQGRIDPGDS